LSPSDLLEPVTDGGRIYYGTGELWKLCPGPFIREEETVFGVKLKGAQLQIADSGL
jgi:hypothetical protein